MDQKRASLPPRHELKFFISSAEADALRRRLRPALRLDAHCRGGRPYAIRSLYFDDVDDSAYYDKVGGVLHRDKYRIRIYNFSDGEIFLERKRKLGDLIQKSSALITRRLCEQLLDGDPRGLQRAENPLLRDVYVQMRTRLLRPKVIVDYEREAYLHTAGNARVTLDLNLRSGLSSVALFDRDLPTVGPLDAGLQILEVKYDAFLPDAVRGLLSGFRAERSAVSKYVLCRRYEPLDQF